MAQGYQANEVTTIDILLEPDALLIQRAEANNARLLKMFPKGYTWTRPIVRTLHSCSYSSARPI